MTAAPRTLLPITVALIALATGTVHFGDALGQDLLERAREKSKVTIGYANQAPYGFTNPDGRLTGEAPEIARIILARMGIGAIEGVVADYASLIPGLREGRFDMIAAGMIVVPARCADILFSEPTFAVSEAFLVREGNPMDLATFEDVAASPDAIVAVTAGTVEGEYARRAGVPEARILVVPDPEAGAAAVEAGQADAFAGTSPALREILRMRGAGSGLEAGEPFATIAGETVAGHGAFAFRKEDAAFAAEFNRYLEDFVGSEGHLALIEPFGLTAADLPERTTEELCRPVS
jgi:polar amino acid transport system substrate-binding protein